MGRKRIITKELAVKIAEKLEAEMRNDGAHDIAEVSHEGKLVASFGIRRGSEKDKGHDHIPKEIYINAHDAKRLGQCPLTRKQWIDKLKEKGLIEEDPPKKSK